jgi:hypothetical protein
MFEELDILFKSKISARKFASSANFQVATTDLTDFDRGVIIHGEV